MLNLVVVEYTNTFSITPSIGMYPPIFQSKGNTPKTNKRSHIKMYIAMHGENENDRNKSERQLCSKRLRNYRSIIMSSLRRKGSQNRIPHFRSLACQLTT